MYFLQTNASKEIYKQIITKSMLGSQTICCSYKTSRCAQNKLTNFTANVFRIRCQDFFSVTLEKRFIVFPV